MPCPPTVVAFGGSVMSPVALQLREVNGWGVAVGSTGSWTTSWSTGSFEDCTASPGSYGPELVSVSC